MQNLFTRTITGIIFVALIIGSLILHPLAFVVMIFFVMVIALLEFFHLANNNGVFPHKALGLTAGSIIYLIPALVALDKISAYYLIFLPLLIIIIFVTEFFRTKPNPLQNVAFSIFPVTYISIPLSMLIFLMSPLVTGGQLHWHMPFSFFIILWSHDTFAYLTGMAFGKHKLFEKISPNKTWEGTAGGITVGLIAAFILSLFFRELNTWQWLG
ncbi:MAG: phosphatidate cytidylyltransferase, partial [Bacteroidales bacterium]|nr:phosphatidate cytidylyltransferase [Bacteroidales bacterium]